MYFRFNGDSASNYQVYGLKFTTTTAALNPGLKSFLDFGKMGNNAANPVDGIMHVFGAKSTGYKPVSISAAGDGSVTNASTISNGYYKGTSAITSVSFISDVGNFDAGTIYVYGAN